MLNEKKIKFVSLKHTNQLNLVLSYTVKGADVSVFLSEYVSEPLLNDEEFIKYLLLDIKICNRVLYIELVIGYTDNSEETLSIEPDATDCMIILNALANMQNKEAKKAYGLLIEALYCNCKTCTNKCIHKYKQRRLPKEAAGLGLCKFLL